MSSISSAFPSSYTNLLSFSVRKSFNSELAFALKLNAFKFPAVLICAFAQSPLKVSFQVMLLCIIGSMITTLNCMQSGDVGHQSQGVPFILNLTLPADTTSARSFTTLFTDINPN